MSTTIGISEDLAPLASEARPSPGTEGRLPRWSSRDWVGLVGLTVISSVLPFVVSAASGDLSIPHNDDWSYRRFALYTLHTGHIRFTDTVDAALVGQVLSVQPLLHIFGGAGWAFGLYGSIAMLCLTIAGYCLARRFVDTNRAIFCVLLLVLFPGVLATVPTFMTDIPALAGSVLCLAVGVASMDRTGAFRWALLIGAMVIGLFAFTIRQEALAAPLAVIVASLTVRPRQFIPTIVLGGGVVALAFKLNTWIGRIPGSTVSTIHTSFAWSAVSAAFVLLAADFGLAILPAALFAVVRKGGAPACALALGGTVLVVLLATFDGLGIDHFSGNLLTQQGVTGQVVLAGSRPTLYPHVIWSALEWAGVIGQVLLGSILVVTLVRAAISGPLKTARRAFVWIRSPKTLLAVFVVLEGALPLVNTTTQTFVFDRYIWPLILPATILLVSHTPTRLKWIPIAATRGVVAILTVCLALTSFALALNADRVRCCKMECGNFAKQPWATAARDRCGLRVVRLSPADSRGVGGATTIQLVRPRIRCPDIRGRNGFPIYLFRSAAGRRDSLPSVGRGWSDRGALSVHSSNRTRMSHP